MSIQEYKMELEIVREMHFNEDSLYGIYAAKPVHYTREVEMNRYNNFSIKGQTRRLSVGEKYMITFNGIHENPNPRYDGNYEILEVEPEKLDTVENQDKFLQAIITENQFNSLKEAYPNPNLLVDLILEDKINTSITKGIKKKSLAKIKSQIELNANISILIAKLNTLNLTTSAINKLLAHFKTSQAVIQAIEEDIYNLCSINNFGFKTVDASAIGRGDDPNNEKRIVACFTYLLKQDNQDGNTWSHRSELIEESTNLLQIDSSLIVECLNKLGKSKKLYIEGEKIAIPSIRRQELSTRDHLWRIYSAYVPPSKIRVENKIKKVEEEQGFDFTDQQRQVIIDSSQDGVCLINGAAGSGKTAIVKGLLSALGINNYMTAALSGKAASVLAERSIRSSTIHRMLKYVGRGFEHDEEEPLEFEVIVLDELSMIDTNLLLSVIKAIKTGSKLILVGDSAQLSSIGYGDIIRDLLDTKAFPTYELTQVHRQSKKSGVLELANKIRSGESVVAFNSSGKQTYGELGDQTIITYTKEEKDSIPYDVLRIAQAYVEKIERPEDLFDFQVLVSNRSSGMLSAIRMNIELQKIFNGEPKPSISRNGYDYKEGDKVIAVGNIYKLQSYSSVEEYLSIIEQSAGESEEEGMPVGSIDVFNGTMGIIKAIQIDSKITFVEFEGIDGLIPYTQTNLEKLSLGYSITIHRAQGSGFKHVLMAIDYSSYMLLNKKLIYTGITRSSFKGILLAENNALHQAIQNEANTRRTFLRELLIESMDVK